MDATGTGKRRARPSPGSSPPPTPPAKRESPKEASILEWGSTLSVPADMSILVCHIHFHDSGLSEDDPNPGPLSPVQNAPVSPYSFVRPVTASTGTVACCRVTHDGGMPGTTVHNSTWMHLPVVDTLTPSPFENNPSLTKYWNQRRRLFSRFDQGIQLDEEGWFSVTPEQIADHVGHRLVQMYDRIRSPQQTIQSPSTELVVLDAFCGCGGNAIAFAKIPRVTVIAVDLDRSKLRKAAHNAAIYEIPAHKLILVECNALFILEHCYRQGQFVLDQPLETPEAAIALMSSMPPPVPTEVTPGGYQVGGLDLLPRRIDAVFMDPPWGGVDYEIFGKHGYDLQRNMRIARPVAQCSPPISDGLDSSFFDTFQSQPRSKSERKALFNSGVDEANCANGAELISLAAAATEHHIVLYDIPRNTSRISLGQAALSAGYRGNCKLDEHYINGRLKTATVYLGCDWSHLIRQGQAQASADLFQPKGPSVQNNSASIK